MTARRALVVDDSRSARAFLTRILERYELAVDGVESAEQAIEYLIHQRPDVIFMDHLMPGMDGFQAVQAIKNNPRTATIPIMMYTSQEGELYLSQARALGAIGVLPKQTQHADVSKALEQLNLLGAAPVVDDAMDVPTVEMRSGAANGAGDGAARRTGTYAALNAADSAATGRHAQIEDTAKLQAPPRAAPPVERRGGSRPNAPALAPEMRAVIEAMLARHMRDLQRFVTDTLENQADRVVGDVRLMMQDKESSAVPATLSASGGSGAMPAARTPGGVLVGFAGVIVACLVGWQWQQQRADSTALAAQLALAQQQLSASHQDLQTLQQAEPVTPAAPSPTASPMRSPETAIEPVPFNEMPLAGPRQDRIQTLLNHLNAQGFRGMVEIRSIPGRFCMVNGSGATPVLAADTLPYGKCEQVGNPREDNGTASERQSVAFANMIAAARQNSSGKLDIEIAAGSADETITPYPPVTDTLTAGEWNKVGAANNRIEVRWQATR